MNRVGLVSLRGIRPLQPISDSIGILARSVSDIQLVARTLGVMRNISAIQPSSSVDLDSSKPSYSTNTVQKVSNPSGSKRKKPSLKLALSLKRLTLGKSITVGKEQVGDWIHLSMPVEVSLAFENVPFIETWYRTESWRGWRNRSQGRSLRRSRMI